MRGRKAAGQRRRGPGEAVRRFREWRRHYMAPSAPAYVLCNAVAGILFFMVYLNGPLILFPVGLGLVLLPLAVAAVAGLFRREAVAEVYYGFLISYRLSAG